MFPGQNTLSLVDCINEVLSRSSLIAAVFIFFGSAQDCNLEGARWEQSWWGSLGNQM